MRKSRAFCVRASASRRARATSAVAEFKALDTSPPLALSVAVCTYSRKALLSSAGALSSAFLAARLWLLASRAFARRFNTEGTGRLGTWPGRPRPSAPVSSSSDEESASMSLGLAHMRRQAATSGCTACSPNSSLGSFRTLFAARSAVAATSAWARSTSRTSLALLANSAARLSCFSL